MSKVHFTGDQAQFKPIVKGLQLENFRGFSQLDISLQEDLTVFISRNGGGKSTILDAIWGGLIALRNTFSQKKDDHIGQVFNRYDVKNGSEGSTIKLNLEVFYQWLQKPEKTAYPEEPEDASTLEVGQKSLPIQLRGNEKSFSLKSDLKQEWKELADFLDHGYVTSDSKPIFKYYQSQGTLSKEANDLEKLTSWIDRRQKVLTQSTNKSLERQLNWLKEAMSDLLSDDEITYTDLKVRYQVDGDFLSITKQQDGRAEELGIQQLSSGEMSMIEIVSDIAISLIEANPTHGDGFSPLTDGFGVVLIDEVGMHLHPGWQRNVLPRLQQTFPNLQFIVTTHSALLLNNISSDHVWLVDDWQAVRPDATFGRDISTIISKIMDTPSNEFEKEYKKIYRLLARNEISEAEIGLEKIRTAFEGSGDDYSPELRKLLAILDRKKILEK